MYEFDGHSVVFNWIHVTYTYCVPAIKCTNKIQSFDKLYYFKNEKKKIEDSWTNIPILNNFVN